jgi:hypothetical protein
MLCRYVLHYGFDDFVQVIVHPVRFITKPGNFFLFSGACRHAPGRYNLFTSLHVCAAYRVRFTENHLLPCNGVLN